MPGPASNYADEIAQAIHEAMMRQGAYARYAPDAYGQQVGGVPLAPDTVVPQDVAAMVEGMQRARQARGE